MCIGCASLCHSEGGIYIYSPRKSCGPNMSDELLKGFTVISADLPRKGVKSLATSGERVNHDSWVKMYNLCRVLKTGILAVLTVKSGLGGSYTKDDELVKLLCSFDYRLCYELIMFIFDHVIIGLFMLPCHLLSNYERDIHY